MDLPEMMNTLTRLRHEHANTLHMFRAGEMDKDECNAKLRKIEDEERACRESIEATFGV